MNEQPSMKLLRIGKFLINPQCISHAWMNSDSAQVKVYISCSNVVVGVVAPCRVESEGKLRELEAAEVEFFGEEAEALKSYFNPERAK